MANNTKQPLISSILVAVLSCFFLGVSRAQHGGGGDGGAALVAAAGAGGTASMSCVEKLQPCQPFLMEHSTTPSPECCTPMKEVITEEAPCLCALFENAALLHSVNITQDNALSLAKECGAKADPSICKTANSHPATPSNAESHSPASNSSSSSNSEASDARNVASPSGVYLVVLSFLGLMM